MQRSAHGSRAVDASPTPRGKTGHEPALHALQCLAAGDRALRSAIGQCTRGCGLNETQSLVLYCCATTPDGLSQNELADRAGVSPPQISSTVDALRREGLLAGHRSALDRRRQVWRATELGHERMEALRRALAVWARDFRSHLPDNALSSLGELVERLLDAVSKASGPGASCVVVGRAEPADDHENQINGTASSSTNSTHSANGTNHSTARKAA